MKGREGLNRPSSRSRQPVFLATGALVLLATLFFAFAAYSAPEPIAARRSETRPTPLIPLTPPTSLTRPTPLTPMSPLSPPTPGTPKAPQPALLYRPVGCQVTGAAQAYLHGPDRRVVAIGFDDGPASDTPAFVRMLEQSHIQATFFMIGRQVTSSFASMLHRELIDGDALGDHTYTHPNLTTSGDVEGQLEQTIEAVRAQTGYTPCVFRPPYGAYDTSVIRTARSLGLATVTWNVDPSDWALPGTAAIEQRVLAQVQPGSIIISHDGGGPRGQTLAAYPHIIAALHARGYRFETIPQMLGFHTVYRRCRKLCDGLGVSRPLPAGSIVERG